MNDLDHYKTLHEYKNEDQFLVMNEVTGDICVRKTLKIYDIDVFRWLSLNHNKHIPTIFDYKESDGVLIVTEQFIAGTTLDEYIKKYTPNEKELVRILCDVCDGLTFLHTAPKPIIHRDLKESNILITDDGTVKIIDYDAAKTYKSGEITDTVLIGTEGSAAPEQYGFAQSDPRTDVFALGVLIKKLCAENSRLNKIAVKATNLDPNNRYQSAAALKRALRLPGYNPLIIPIGLSSLGAVLVLFAVLMNLPKTPDRNMFAIQGENELVVQDASQVTPLEIPSLNIDIDSTTESKESAEIADQSQTEDTTTDLESVSIEQSDASNDQTASSAPISTTEQTTSPVQTNNSSTDNTTPESSTASTTENTTVQTTETSSVTYQQAYNCVYYVAIESDNPSSTYRSYEGIISRCLSTSAGIPESDFRAALDSIVAEYGIDFYQRAYESAYYLMRRPYSYQSDMTLNIGYSEAKIRDCLSTAQFTQFEIDYACSQFDWNQEAVYYCNYLTIRPHSGGPYSWDQAVQLSVEEAWFTQEQAEAAATQVGFTNDIPEWIYG